MVGRKVRFSNPWCSKNSSRCCLGWSAATTKVGLESRKNDAVMPGQGPSMWSGMRSISFLKNFQQQSISIIIIKYTMVWWWWWVCTHLLSYDLFFQVETKLLQCSKAQGFVRLQHWRGVIKIFSPEKKGNNRKYFSCSFSSKLCNPIIKL